MRSERVSSSQSAVSPPLAGSGEPRPGRGGLVCCQVEVVGSSHSSGSGRSSSAEYLSWASSHRSEAPGGYNYHRQRL